MTLPATNLSTSASLVPTTIISRDGQRVPTHHAVWSLRQRESGGSRISLMVNHDVLIAVLDPMAHHTLLGFLAHRLTRKAPQTVANDLGTVIRFCKHVLDHSAPEAPQRSLGWHDLTEGVLLAFLHHGLGRPSVQGNDFSRMRTFYRWGCHLGLEGFSLDLLLRLESTRAPGNLKGEAVRRSDPQTGALIHEEVRLVTRALHEGQSSIEMRLVVRLCLELGCNPLSLALLRHSDYQVRQATGGGEDAILWLPLTKKRGGAEEFRVRSISRSLQRDLAEVHQPDSATPLLRFLAIGSPSTQICAMLRSFVKANGLISGRTGEPLHLTPRRFRYTLATTLAEQGASALHIANVLGHTDTQQVSVYAEASPSVVERLGPHLEPAYSSLLKIFRGEIVFQAEEASGPTVPGIDVHLGLSLGGIGHCAKIPEVHGVCQLTPPLSCYLCAKFRALSTAPHNEVLASLDTTIEHFRTQNERRLPYQLQEVRDAVAELVDRLEEPTQ